MRGNTSALILDLRVKNADDIMALNCYRLIQGMSLAANINAIALIDLFRENSTLRELFVDLGFELLDEEMVRLFEFSMQTIFDSLTLINIRSRSWSDV